MSTDLLPPFPIITTVEFRHIPNAFGYCASSGGHIYRCIFGGSYKKIRHQWKEMPGSPHCKTRHLMITVAGRHTYVHIIILETFVGPCPHSMECCHNDGNPQNNALKNLRWDTRRSNVNDTMLHGRIHKGENHPASKLMDLEVLNIRKLYSQGIIQERLSKIFGISRSTISRIVNGKTRTHLPIEENPFKKTHKLSHVQKIAILQMKSDGISNAVIVSAFKIDTSCIWHLQNSLTNKN